MVKIAILLATYNSSKYLREQLDSLFAQTFKDWNLVIRDDGSNDDTCEIVKEYQKIYSNVSLLEDGDFGVGAKESFMRLLKNTDADYFFFCDHDDVWLPDKVGESLELMFSTEKSNYGKPILIHADLKVVNQNLEVISESFWKSSAIKPKLIENKNMIQVFNCATGCTMFFNGKAKLLSLPYPSSIPMHDWWLAIVTLRNNGVIKHITKPNILYRQHESNVVGARNFNTNYFFNKLKKISDTFAGQKQIRDFLKDINGLSFFQYYYYKMIYTLIRKL